MRSIHITSPSAVRAATHLLQAPPLAYNPWVASHRMEMSPGHVGLKVNVTDGVMSSGEESCLIPLLETFSVNGHFFDLRSLWRVDEDTRMVAYQAIGIYSGCIPEVVTS